MKKSKSQPDLIKAVGELLEDLKKSGYNPTLVGGMALITLGSTRVTQDFDFVLEKEAEIRRELVDTLYRYGFELISKVNEQGNVVRTVDNRNVAFAKLQMDDQNSIFFYNHDLGLRIDFMFDFPFPAKEVRKNAHHKKIESYSFYIADKKDLIRMKEIAVKDRNKSKDIQDLEFLKKL